MKKIISFKKSIDFPSMLGEITSISLDHTLNFIDESNIAGDFKITGSYKLTEASRLEEKFNYTIPTEIVLNERLDLETANITIADFYYEIDSDITMICYIDVKVEGIELIEITEEKEEPKIEPILEEETIRCVEEKEVAEERECDGDKVMEKETLIPSEENIADSNSKEDKDTILNNKEFEQDNQVEKTESLFTSLDSSEETFSTYSVYILRQEETVQSIIEKYHVTKEELENYNDLTNLSVGTKIIIPNIKND